MAHPETDENGSKETESASSLLSCRSSQYIHKVGVPLKQHLFKEFAAAVKETLFADEPLNRFNRARESDLIAGLTTASLCIPQDIGYAKLANLDPLYGLYSSFVPPLVYAFMGSSPRDIAIGPVAVVSLLLGSLLQDEIDSSANPVDYRYLALTATFFAGLTQLLLGFFRLGFLIDFLSHAAIVGFMADENIREGINPLSAKEIFFSGEYVGKGFKIGVVREAVAIGRTLASMKDYQLDGNKEMVALGTKNIVGSLTSCYVATGSFSLSAVNHMSGCETVVSNIVMAIAVLLTLALFTPLFKYTPNAIVASIIIFAVVGLVDIDAVALIWKVDKFDFAACMGAFFGVVFSFIEIGLLIAVSISFAKILLQVTRPRTAILGKVPRTNNVYRNILQYPDATKVAGILIVRVDSAIYFSNSNYVKERILRWLADEEEEGELKGKFQPRIQYLIVEMCPVTDIDTSGIHALEKRNVKLVLSNPGPVVVDKLDASKFADLIGEERIFLTVADASKTQQNPLFTLAKAAIDRDMQARNRKNAYC
ncbi:High affinity sulfate transporter 2 [Hibiscus syriacus]|uniref:High affinity sulfate transporter 2 n=1 Tax=Hibiscus syriacus TaxID=106335 RepID=A0A6A2YG02_HIBSY|nr:High affinity sulfate transporter 2 [Hibiscus syriacus]